MPSLRQFPILGITDRWRIVLLRGSVKVYSVWTSSGDGEEESSESREEGIKAKGDNEELYCALENHLVTMTAQAMSTKMSSICMHGSFGLAVNARNHSHVANVMMKENELLCHICNEEQPEKSEGNYE